MSKRFAPSHGGVQTVVRLFALGLCELGHAVTVITHEPAEVSDAYPFRVVRKPSRWTLLQEYRKADHVVLHGPAVSLGWPVLITRRPTTVIHYILEPAPAYRRRLIEVVRRAMLRRCRHASVSAGFFPDIPYPCPPATMPIDTSLFRKLPGVPRDRDLFFIGRWLDFKGVHDLIDALKLLNARGKQYSLTMVGDGVERERIIRRVEDEGLTSQVDLRGPLDGDELVHLMNRHRLVMVPSRYHEPFGLVALEGIACGCVAIGTKGGGLPGAIGPCGLTVPNGDVSALAGAVEQLLEPSAELARYLKAAHEHVAQHTPVAAAEGLLRLLTA